MGFAQMEESVYWFRNQGDCQPDMHKICACFQDDDKKQVLTDSMMTELFVDCNEDEESEDSEEEKQNEEEDKENKQKVKLLDKNDVDLKSCVLLLSSEVNATNNQIAEDFTAFFTAKLEQRT